MKMILSFVVALLLICPMTHLGCNLDVSNEQSQTEISKEKEIESKTNASLYLLVLATTLPVISVFLILLVPRKTEQLIAFDLDKNKKKTVQLGLKKREKDDDEML